MDLIYKIILPIHIIAGSISLILFWVPVMTKKGGRIHVKSGIAYLYTMWITVSTAALLSIHNLISGDYFSALFLGFLSLLTAKPLWYGIAIVRMKSGLSEQLYQKRKYIEFGVVIFGLANVLFALYMRFEQGTILLFFFGLIGVSGLRDLRIGYDQFMATVDPIRDHIVGMLVSGIAAYTAFLAFGGRTLLGNVFEGSLMIIPWMAPTVIGFIGIKWYTNKWAKKKVTP